MSSLNRYVAIAASALVLCGSLFAQAPPAPANLTVTPMPMPGGAMLHWDTSAGALGYRIYRSVDGLPYGPLGIVARHEFADFFVYPHNVYKYYVTALNLSGESGSSDTVTFVVGPPPPPPGFGIINGLVSDDSTFAPINGALVQFFKPLRNWRMRFALTDSTGNYSIALDSGLWVFRAGALGYLPKWYPNKYVPDSASLVNLTPHDTVEGNFLLHAIRPPGRANVSGIVTDTSGAAVQGAWVAFLRTPHELLEIERLVRLFGGLPRERFFIQGLGHLHGVLWAGKTDSTGSYTASVPEGLKCIALAFKQNYHAVFYNGKVTPFDADRLVFSGDSSGINFALVPHSAAQDSIGGTVVDSNGVGIAAHVMLVRLTALGPLITRYKMTDSLGNFQWNHVDPGRFLLRAIPVDGYRPAWYSATKCGVRNYHNADTIFVPASMTGLQVCVKADADSGFGNIAGVVSKPPAGMTVQGTLAPPAVTVSAISSTSGDVVAYDQAEPDGSFSLENLPPDSYTLSADVAGFTSSASGTYVVSEANYTQSSASLSVTPDVPLAVGKPQATLPAAYALEQNYPNPFNPSTVIRYELPAMSNVKLTVYNVIGQVVATLKNGVETAGAKSVEFNASALPSGVYFYRLEATGTANPHSAFTMVKKLMLLK